MKTLVRALLLGALILVAGPTLAEQEVFRWVDDNGIVHYSDRPMDPDAEATGLVYNNTDPAQLREQQMRAWEQQQQQAARSTEQTEEAEQERVTQAERARQRESGCQAARDRLERYSTAQKLYQELPDGERRYLTADEITEERDLAVMDVENWCGE